MPHVRTYAEIANCATCGAPFKRRADQVKSGRGLYCSVKCATAARSKPLTMDIASVKRMYCEQNMTMDEIAEQAGVNWKRIRSVLDAEGVEIRRKARRRNPARRSAATYQKMIATKPGQVVHHLNCNETDDRPENLVAVSRLRHGRLHKQLAQISGKLWEAGLVSFDPQNGYEITPKLSRLMES